MALRLREPETDRLAGQVAALTGESLTEAVRVALAERLARERTRRGAPPRLAEALATLARDAGALPGHDTRAPDDIIGYGDTGFRS